MIQELIEFTTELFPSITPYTKDEIYTSIEKFQTEGRTFTTTLENQFEYLAQGDILYNIPFVRIDDDGNVKTFKANGMIMANTCDCDRRENILIAPFISIEKINRADKSQILANRVL